MYIYSWGLLLILSITACHPRKSGAQSIDNHTNEIQSQGVIPDSLKVRTWTRQEAASGPESFRLVISFISIGEGTDLNAATDLNSFISRFESQTGKSIAYIMIPWGREGEVDCCFEMNELDQITQSKFIADVKAAFSGRKLIQITENGKNRFR